MSICFWPAVQNINGDNVSPPSIVRNGQWTIVLVHAVSTNSAVVLPADCEIGDVVEVHNDIGGNTPVLPPSGDTMELQASSAQTPNLFRKLGANFWGFLHS